MGPKGCHETSVRDYHYSMRKKNHKSAVHISGHFGFHERHLLEYLSIVLHGDSRLKHDVNQTE
jgi:hypothetical protein